MNKLFLLNIIFFLFAVEYLPAQLSATTNQTNPTCVAATGSASVTPSGGSNYTYKWSNGATTASVSGLSGGNYTVTVYSSVSTGFTYDTLYKETFTEASPLWTLNTSTGTNAAGANYWTISNIAGYAGSPGQCTDNNGGQNTLFITSNVNDQLFPGCTYYAGTLGGGGDDATTNTAAESPNITTTSAHNLLLQFDFTAGGDNIDKASLLYSVNGGTSFNTLNANMKTSNTNPNCICYDVIVGSYTDQNGTWQHGRYALPSQANNINNLQIQFNWTNNNDEQGADPSIAVTNILVIDSAPTGGASVDSIVKTVDLVSSGSAGPDSVTANPLKMCSSDSSQLCAVNAFAHYVWNTVLSDNAFGDTTQCIYVKDAGDYYVGVTDNNGCTATSNHVEIVVYPVPSVSIVVQGDTLATAGQVSYQWYLNGSQIPGATLPVYIEKASGAYQVQVTDTNGCKTLSSIVTGIRDLANDVNFEIYPNPASTATILLSIGTACMNCDIEMFDALGQSVFRAKVIDQKQEIDISKLAKGVYTIRVAGGTRKFIKE